MERRPLWWLPAPIMNPLDESYPQTLWLSAATALLGSLQQGYELSILTQSLDYLSTAGTSNESILSSAMLLGAVIGSFSARSIALAHGPKRSLAWGSVAYFLGSVLSSLELYGNYGFLLARLLSGLGEWPELSPLEMRMAHCVSHED